MKVQPGEIVSAVARIGKHLCRKPARVLRQDRDGILVESLDEPPIRQQFDAQGEWRMIRHSGPPETWLEQPDVNDSSTT